MTRKLAILTVKDEGAFLLEWLAHHQMVGFTDFLIFSNDCADGTDLMLHRLEEMGQITHVSHEAKPDKSVQWQAMKQAAKHPLLKEADWILALDIDEFVNIHIGDGSLNALIHSLPEADAITLTWRLFGNAGIVYFEDAPVTQQFTSCAPKPILWPWRASMFKTLYRNNGIYRKPGIHRPISPDQTRVDEARWYDGSGRLLGGDHRRQRVFSNYTQDTTMRVQLNHYALGAMDSFLLKRARGRGVHFKEKIGMDYWVDYNFNSDQDVSISRYQSARAARVTELKSDATLKKLHDKACEWRHKRFKELLESEPERAFFARLMMAGQTTPLTEHTARQLISVAMRANQKAAAESE